jgi:hypothetical protein
MRNVTKGKGFFYIFYCHPPGFYAIKEKLHLRLASGFEIKSCPTGRWKKQLKGGMGVQGTHFPNSRRIING